MPSNKSKLRNWTNMSRHCIPKILMNWLVLRIYVALAIFQSHCDFEAGDYQASVTIMADFSPEFNPPVRWRSKHQTKNDC